MDKNTGDLKKSENTGDQMTEETIIRWIKRKTANLSVRQVITSKTNGKTVDQETGKKVGYQ